MKKQIAKLTEILRSSTSDEEFWLKAAVEGSSFPVEILFRLCLLRQRHPNCERLELTLLGLDVIGFSSWAAMIGPKNPFGGVGILLLAITILVPLEILVMKFEMFCRKLFEKNRQSDT